MKITINTDILKKHDIAFGEFLIMLLGYYNFDFNKLYQLSIDKQLIEKDMFNTAGIILSNNNKDLVAKILVESNDKVLNSNIDFEDLANKLIACYPKGNKPGTTHPWGSDINTIAFKLRTLVANYNFIFTENEAISAVKSYLNDFKELNQDTLLLRSFILRTSKNEGNKEIESLFMTYIENMRNNNN